jgi:hypothetical protein
MSGCAGHSVSAPDGPLTFEFACKGWEVAWARQDDPYIGVLSRTADAEPPSGDPVADYLKCSSLAQKRGLAPAEPPAKWATARFHTDPAQQVLDSPPGDPLDIQVGSYQSAAASELDLPEAEGKPEVVVVVIEGEAAAIDPETTGR